MNLETAISRLRVLLSTQNGIEESVTETVTFATAELVDGSIVKVDGELEVGKPLFVETPEGDVQAPSGLHQTVDGLLISVDESGIIVSIEPVAEEEVVVEQKSEFSSEDFITTLNEILNPLKEEIASLKEQLNVVKTEFSAFREEPAGKRINNNIKNNEFQATSLVDAKMQRILAIRNGKKIN
jgi:uncharacterized coiled-coil protein SlyX